ncbi:hypothetical protein JCM5353_004597 [Sporobolomyces roseus]
MSSSNSPSSQSDYLSQLPNELLNQIFEDVYANWNQGVEAGIKLRKLIKPISKRFLEFQRRGLYRNVTIRTWTGPGSPTSLVNAVVEQPSLGSLIVSLHFDISPDRTSTSLHQHCTEAELPSDRIVSFFHSLVGLRRLTLAGCFHQENSAVLTIYANHRIVLLALACMMENVNVTSVREEWTDNTGSGYGATAGAYSPPSVPAPPGNLPSTRISQLFVRPRDAWAGSYRWRPGVHRNGFVTFDLRPRESSPLPSTAASDSSPSPPALQQSISSVSPLFSSLTSVTFNEYTSKISSPLLNLFHRFPVKSLVLNAQYALPLSHLINLVTKSTHIDRIDLQFDGRRVGRIGTRVSTVDFDSAFRGIDLETEDIAQDAMPDDWLYPQLPPNFSIVDFLRFRKQVDEAGIDLVEHGLIQAIEVQQAAEEDLELLDELWQQWRKDQKKTKKSGKGRKSKK